VVSQDDDEKLESRPPTITDLSSLCQELNRQGAQYIVIGGMAMIQTGFIRATEDIDLLIESSQGNQAKVRAALMKLPDKAVREVHSEDLDSYTVVRVADEFVVDLMKAAGGIDFDRGRDRVLSVRVEGVEIPFASPALLWEMKQTGREKDRLDLLYLKELLKK
jgi:hypothetical protein